MTGVALREEELREQVDAAASLIGKLSVSLEQMDLGYCYWKSTETLQRAPQPEDDLDLLVSRLDAQHFVEIIEGLGFKRARAPRARDFPGVVHYYGLDAETGGLVHLHAYFQLVLGHDTTKNYRLPIEEAYISSAVRGHTFRIPAPEFEFAVFVVRMVLKHGTWDAIIGLQGSLSAGERREFGYLKDRVDGGRLERVVAEHLPFVGNELFDRCVKSLDPTASKWFRIGVGHRLVRSLAVCARRPQLADVSLKTWGRGSWLARRVFVKQSLRHRLEHGGAIIAVVGGDGAGKSTLVDGLHRWLSGPFLAVKVHLGKPPRSAAFLALRAWLLVRRLIRLTPTAPGSAPAMDALAFPGYAWAIRHVLVARDRRREYRRARRLTSKGGIVLCDRYHVPNIRLMDGPRLSSAAESPRPLRRFLAKLERRYYEQILPPDLLIVLQVDPQTAATRKVEEDDAFVRARVGEVWQADWESTPAIVIDADQPLSHVTREVKSLVWSRL